MVSSNDHGKLESQITKRNVVLSSNLARIITKRVALAFNKIQMDFTIYRESFSIKYNMSYHMQWGSICYLHKNELYFFAYS